MDHHSCNRPVALGAPKLPALAKSAAQSMRIFKKEIDKNGEPTEVANEASESEKKQD